MKSASPAFATSMPTGVSGASSRPRCAQCPLMSSTPSSTLSRRALLRLAVAAAAVSSLPSRSDAALETREEAQYEARAARAALGGLALIVAEKKFDEARRLLRAGALSRIRAAGRTLVVGPPSQAAYRKLVAGVEEFDGVALRASRGDTAAAERALGVLDRVVEDFDAFLDLIPGMEVSPSLAQ